MVFMTFFSNKGSLYCDERKRMWFRHFKRSCQKLQSKINKIKEHESEGNKIRKKIVIDSWKLRWKE